MGVWSWIIRGVWRGIIWRLVGGLLFLCFAGDIWEDRAGEELLVLMGL